MDSARAEELIAGLGFNVDGLPSSATEGPRGRKRTRPKGNTGAQFPDQAAAPAPDGGAAAGKKVYAHKSAKYIYTCMVYRYIDIHTPRQKVSFYPGA